MSDDDTGDRSTSAQTATDRRGLFSIPPPLKRLFDRFPLVTYPASNLPFRASRRDEEHVLYVFSTVEDAKYGRPSYNPSCLRWQAFLKFAGMQFRTTPSNNHASTTGSLPILIPASTSKGTSEPVAGNKLQKWVKLQGSQQHNVEEPDDIRYEAYASLVNNCIRRAWLYQLYVVPSNSTLVDRLYVSACSSNPLVRLTIHRQLRRAAEAELSKSSQSTIISAADLMDEAGDALSALATLLGEDAWFFGASHATLFDASVFAYTHLLLDDQKLQWEENRLGKLVKEHENLLQHRERICQRYF